MEDQNMVPEAYPSQPAPKKSNTGMIITIVVVLLLCCCCILGIGGWWLYVNGDQLMNTSLLLNIL